MRFFYTVWVDTDTQKHADQIMEEWMNDPADWYGFDYTVDYRPMEATNDWAVFDAVTGDRYSDRFEMRAVASALCRSLNTREAGGRYHVRRLVEGKWVRT